MVKAIMLVRLTADLEVKTSSSGTSYAQFSGAADTGYGNNKKSNFYRFSAFGKTAEAIAKYTSKGSQILLECEPQQNQYTDKDGNKRSEIVFVVQGFNFIGSKSSNTSKPSSNGTDFVNVPDGIDEELPFN
jgi:single-strand DNA-binding protein